MKTLALPLAALAVLSAAACKPSETTQDGDTLAATSDPLILAARDNFKPIPEGPAQIAGVTATPELVALGEALYFDPRLSQSHALSCASCHNMGLGGADARPTSIGHHWQLGGRNAPTVLNAGYNFVQFWDGRAEDLVAQAAGPIANPVEMAMLTGQLVPTLKSIPGYAPMFAKAFPAEADPISEKTVPIAIAAYEATLVTPNAPFDRFLRGDAAALTDQQKRGLKSFMDSGCTACHSGTNVGGAMYAKFGLVADPSEDVRPAADTGRFAITGDEADRYAFKVPTLRNIALSAPYFHTGSVWSLDDAVQIMAKTQVGKTLSAGETADIVAFLGALTGDQPKVAMPVLPPVTGKSVKPVN
ncbi:MAG: cytochrome-c peroxidase [Sphingomonadales bacterium]|nr:cytochrome-c peroxidase [Sphingomonadales bacterium]MBD3773291.1 cytochrome-c peroxidase [Paracoccaceae bacterium]